MKFKTPIPLEAIAGKYNCEIFGDASLIATGINEIHKVEAGDITFVDVEKYFQKKVQITMPVSLAMEILQSGSPLCGVKLLGVPSPPAVRSLSLS